MADLVFDFGNARIKWHNPRTSVFADTRHAIAPLREDQWQAAVGRAKLMPHGYIRVNGAPFAVGDKARRWVIQERPSGAARYRREYYGVGLAYAMVHSFKKSARNVTLMASHAPDDIQYVPNLIASAKGDWHVSCEYGDLTFSVKDVQTGDEPLFGYCHYTLTETGDDRKKNPLANLTTLVIDVGGYTTDVVAIDPGGVIDLMSAKSTRAGVIALLEGFERALRSRYRALFQDTGDIDVIRLENALLEGFYRYGKDRLDCKQEATEAIMTLTNDVKQVIDKAGGAANYDYMVLTGGGAALIQSALVQVLPRVEFLLAEPQRENMKFANVFGGAKMLALLRKLGGA